MTPTLDTWLMIATRGLAGVSATQVRSEIAEHYRSAFDDAADAGATDEEADRAAINALGDPKMANRQYREVLLTRSEARILSQTKFECATLGRHLRWLLVLPAALLFVGIEMILAGKGWGGTIVLLGSFGMALIFGAPLLNIRTPQKARVVRGIRWVWLAAILIAAFWPDVLKNSVLIATCAWPMFWSEWVMASIRRKLPVDRWPRHLFM